MAVSLLRPVGCFVWDRPGHHPSPIAPVPSTALHLVRCSACVWFYYTRGTKSREGGTRCAQQSRAISSPARPARRFYLAAKKAKENKIP